MSQLRALIVDDEEPIRTMLAAVVQQSGFDVDTAADGAEAIASIDRDGYSVLLLDIMMPRVNGYDVLRHLEAKRPDLLRRGHGRIERDRGHQSRGTKGDEGENAHPC